MGKQVLFLDGVGWEFPKVEGVIGDFPVRVNCAPFQMISVWWPEWHHYHIGNKFELRLSALGLSLVLRNYGVITYCC